MHDDGLLGISQVPGVETILQFACLIGDSLDSSALLQSNFSNPSNITDRPRNRSAVADAMAWRARELIGHQLDDVALTPTRLASQMQVSLRRLQQIFHGQGTTLSDCIWDARLEFARGLLALATQRQESVSTIAMRSGFSDVAHFCRRLKQRYGLPPSEYRATLH